MKRTLLALLALSVLPLAHAQDAPCTAGLGAKVTPCADPPLAQVGDKQITTADLDEATRAKVAGLDAAVAEARKKALRAEIDDLLFEQEAARRGVTVGRLLETEVLAKVMQPNEVEVAAEIASDPKKYRRGKGDAEWASAILYERRLGEREKAFAVDLEKRFPVAHADDVRGATVGKKKVDAAHARLRMDTAEASARGEVVMAQQMAIQRMSQSARVLVKAPRYPRQSIAVDRSPSTGPKDAKVTLVEFGDFQCPPCGQMYRIVEQALQPYDTRVRYVFRQFPLYVHPYAWKAAEAALAANAQGKFWEYERMLFTHQNQLDVASLKRHASEVGLDRAKFDADLDSGRYARDVIEDRRAGERAGIRGTPMFFINGELMPDEGYSVSGMRAVLDAALAAAK